MSISLITIDIVVDIMSVYFGLRGYQLAQAIIYPGYNLAWAIIYPGKI